MINSYIGGLDLHKEKIWVCISKSACVVKKLLTNKSEDIIIEFTAEKDFEKVNS